MVIIRGLCCWKVEYDVCLKVVLWMWGSIDLKEMLCEREGELERIISKL